MQKAPIGLEEENETHNGNSSYGDKRYWWVGSAHVRLRPVAIVSVVFVACQGCFRCPGLCRASRPQTTGDDQISTSVCRMSRLSLCRGSNIGIFKSFLMSVQQLFVE